MASASNQTGSKHPQLPEFPKPSSREQGTLTVLPAVPPTTLFRNTGHFVCSCFPSGCPKEETNRALWERVAEAGARFDLRLIWSKMLSVIKLHRYSRGIDWKRVVQRLIIPGFCCRLKRRHGENCKRGTHPGIGRGKNGKWGPVLFFLG